MNVDPETSKAQLRARIRSQRADRAASQPEPSVSGPAWRLIETLWPDLDLSGRSLLAYAALAGEPDLDPVIDRFLSHGGTVYLPVVTQVGRALMFGTVTDSMATLEPRGKWGIREPAPTLTATELLSAEVALDLVFVPALGFGSGGARLGNGGGFYDRTFGPQGEVPLAASDQFAPDNGGHRHIDGSEHIAVHGVCFAAELDLPGLTVEPWDLHITQAVTDNGVRTFA